MKTAFLNIFLFAACAVACAQTPKIVGDCTVTFNITGNNAAISKNLAGAVKTFYVKGKLCRVDVANTDYQQSVIYNYTTGNAVVLQQIGANKYMSKLTAEKWKQKNNRYIGAAFAFANDIKTILGYECKKGTATLADGSSFSFYYAAAIMPSVQENPYQFKDIPGFVLEYEIADKDKKTVIAYTATKIDFSPVPESKFDTPTAGYLVQDN